jgi:AcrR family transcriptional regulator
MSSPPDAPLSGPGSDPGASRPARPGRRPRGRPPARQSEQTEAEILRAARVCFSKRGYARTSVAQIAREAGVTSRAIYHYVDSKPELFVRAALAAHVRVADEIRGHLASGRGAQGAQDTLGRWIAAFMALFEQDPSLVQFLSLVVVEAERNPELAQALPREDVGISAVTRWLVDQAVAHGELAPGVDPAGAVTLLEVFGAGLTLLAHDERKHDYRAMLDVLGRLIDGTLFARPVARPAGHLPDMGRTGPGQP